jgi:N-acetylmuramic acid 6-phosphate etherase
MDCSELPVTFSVEEDQFVAIVAGGSEAIIKAQEVAEDSEEDGSTQLGKLQVTSKDTVIGISASGRTPFVLGALRVAIRGGAVTASITNATPSAIGSLGVTHSIVPLLGPELLAGSTRLKCGSAAKQILNMISTCSMIKMGKTYHGLMIDVRAKNHKLLARGRRFSTARFKIHTQ